MVSLSRGDARANKIYTIARVKPPAGGRRRPFRNTGPGASRPSGARAVPGRGPGTRGPAPDRNGGRPRPPPDTGPGTSFGVTRLFSLETTPKGVAPHSSPPT